MGIVTISNDSFFNHMSHNPVVNILKRISTILKKAFKINFLKRLLKYDIELIEKLSINSFQNSLKRSKLFSFNSLKIINQILEELMTSIPID